MKISKTVKTTGTLDCTYEAGYITYSALIRDADGNITGHYPVMEPHD